MSLGQLGLHVAQTPGAVARLVTPDVLDTPPQFVQPEAGSRREILDALTASVADAQAYLNGLSDEQMTATWKMTAGGRTLRCGPMY